LISPARPRNLGLLYRDAPGWPFSIGSKRKAREWLERAAALAPDYPENQLNLAESHCAGMKPDEAEKGELKKLDALWPARANQFHRRSLGAKLGRLDARRRRRAQKNWPNFKKPSKARPVNCNNFRCRAIMNG
jgi:hypothetical protein